MKLIFIGGVPRTGKTTLARKISVNLGIPWISTDALEAIAHQYIPEEDRDRLFPKSVMRRKTNRKNDEFYTTYTTSEILDSYYTQAETVGAAVEALAKYATKDDWDYIIEGYHITPQLLKRLRDQGVNFSAVILVNTNPAEAINRSRQSKVKNDWIRDNTKNEETYAKICDGIKAHSEKLVQESEAHDIPCRDMGQNFESKTEAVYTLLTQ